MKKVVIITMAVVAALVVLAGASMYCLFHQQYAAAQSVEQVDEKMNTVTSTSQPVLSYTNRKYETRDYLKSEEHKIK